MRRILPNILFCLLALTARSQKAPHPKTPASYEVHITPTTLATGTESTTTPTSLVSRGFDLKSLIAQAWSVESTRIDFPDKAAAAKRFDISIHLPHDEPEEFFNGLLQQALQKQLHLTIYPEHRIMDVYLAAAPHGHGPGLHPSKSMGGAIGSSDESFEFPIGAGKPPTADEMDRKRAELIASTGIAVSSISMSSGTVAEFLSTLERSLDRLIVDETNITGEYDLEVKRSGATKQQFFQIIQDQLGIILTPASRSISILVVRPG